MGPFLQEMNEGAFADSDGTPYLDGGKLAAAAKFARSVLRHAQDASDFGHGEQLRTREGAPLSSFRERHKQMHELHDERAEFRVRVHVALYPLCPAVSTL